MRTVRITLIAGAAVLATAAMAGRADARSPETHVLTIQLPNGEVEQIRYAGDIPPEIILSPSPIAAAMAAPATAFDMAAPFAMLDRISTEMDREVVALMREAEALAQQSIPNPERLITAGINMPPGSHGYAVVVNVTGNGVCTRSMQIAASGDDAAPRVVTHVSGDCGPTQGVTPAQHAATPRPGTLEVKDQGTRPMQPYAGLVHRIAARQYE